MKTKKVTLVHCYLLNSRFYSDLVSFIPFPFLDLVQDITLHLGHWIFVFIWLSFFFFSFEIFIEVIVDSLGYIFFKDLGSGCLFFFLKGSYT